MRVWSRIGLFLWEGVHVILGDLDALVGVVMMPEGGWNGVVVAWIDLSHSQ